MITDTATGLVKGRRREAGNFQERTLFSKITRIKRFQTSLKTSTLVSLESLPICGTFMDLCNSVCNASLRECDKRPDWSVDRQNEWSRSRHRLLLRIPSQGVYGLCEIIIEHCVKGLVFISLLCVLRVRTSHNV